MLYSIKKIFIVLVFLQINFVNANDNDDDLEQINSFCETKCHQIKKNHKNKSLENIYKTSSGVSKRLTSIIPTFSIATCYCLTLYAFNVDNSTDLLKTTIGLFIINIILIKIKEGYISSNFFNSFVRWYQSIFDVTISEYAIYNILTRTRKLNASNPQDFENDAINSALLLVANISFFVNSMCNVSSLYYTYYYKDEKINNELYLLKRCMQDKNDVFFCPQSFEESDKNSIFFKNLCKWIADCKDDNNKIEDKEKSNINEDICIINNKFNLKMIKISKHETLTGNLLASLIQKNSCLVLEASSLDDKKNKYMAIINHGIKYFILINQDLDSLLLMKELLSNIDITPLLFTDYISIIKFDSLNKLLNLQKDIFNYFDDCDANVNIFKFKPYKITSSSEGKKLNEHKILQNKKTS